MLGSCSSIERKVSPPRLRFEDHDGQCGACRWWRQSQECWHVRCNVTWLHDCGSMPEWETDANDECGLTEEIEREIGIKIEFEPTGDEGKRKFTDKTQDELIELLIRAQVRVLLLFRAPA